MIKANELRIGNLVFAEDEFLHMTTYAKVLWLMPNKILWESVMEVSKGTTQEDLPIDIEPIPITPDILIKCGFKKNNLPLSDQWYNNEIDWAYYSNNGELFIGCENENGYEIPIKIKYVHELQNLYHSLYQQELNIEGL